jgi:hypothetical protein
MDIHSISNINFKLYKKQLIALGFRHKEAKTLLKYIIRYHIEFCSYDKLLFADIYYFYEFIIECEYKNKLSRFVLLVKKIINNWLYRNYNYDYEFLFSKLSLFGDFIPWARIYADIEVINITKMLSLYYHQKEIENDDIKIFTDIIEYVPHAFCNESHKLHFINEISGLFKTKTNWETFLTTHEDVRNINYQLPQELIDSVYRKLFM